MWFLLFSAVGPSVKKNDESVLFVLKSVTVTVTVPVVRGGTPEHPDEREHTGTAGPVEFSALEDFYGTPPTRRRNQKSRGKSSSSSPANQKPLALLTVTVYLVKT